MKNTTIKVAEDTLMKVNRYKYQWCLKSQDAVIRRLFELCSKIQKARSSSTPNSKNSIEEKGKELAVEKEDGAGGAE